MESAKEDTGILALEDERLDPEVRDSGVLALAEGHPLHMVPNDVMIGGEMARARGRVVPRLGMSPWISILSGVRP